MNTIQYFETCCKLCKEQWHACSSEFSLEMKQISDDEKRQKEVQVRELMGKVTKHIDNFPGVIRKRKKWKKQGEVFIEKIIGKDDLFKLENMGKDMREGLLETTKQFTKKARNFDPTLSIESISQAMRNIWIIGILQGIMKEKQKFSGAIFGYSMLYPYTDNYLDDTSIKRKEKEGFNKRLYKRLKGENIKAENPNEEKVFELISYIERVYDRGDYPQVYESLLLIFEGQVKSLNQQDGEIAPNVEDILKVSIEKGGSSVLVDGYLISGNLSSEEIKFCVEYGFFLQLADDLQDIKEDIKNKHRSIMTQLAREEKLDTITNKLINFIDKILNDFEIEDVKLKELIHDDCIALILFSIVLNKEYFSQEYIEGIIKYLPFSVTFMEELREEMSIKVKENTAINDHDRVMRIIDEMIS